MKQSDLFTSASQLTGFELPLYNPNDLPSQGRSKSDDTRSAATQLYLQRLRELPSTLLRPPPPGVDCLDELEREFEHAAELFSVLRKHLALCHLIPSAPFTPPPLLLIGPPGVVKTYLAKRIAEVAFTHLWEFNFSHATAGFSLSGLDDQYSTGGPGWLLKAVIDSVTKVGHLPQPLVLLDEIDKAPVDASHNPLGALFSLLEPHSAGRFIDDGFRVPVNLSWLTFIATANSTSSIPEALLSRFRVIEIPSPTADQRARLARRLFVKELLSHPWGASFEPVLTNDVVAELDADSARDLRITLREALGAAALRQSTKVQLCDLPRRRSASQHRVGFL